MCDPCYEIDLKTCPATIDLIAGLLASTSYYWLFTTRSGKKYQRQLNTEADGKLIIDASVFPEGSLNQHSGTYELEIREGANYLNVVTLTLGGKTYKCVKVRFVVIDADPANPYNVIK